MNTATDNRQNRVTLLSKKGMKELKKAVIQLEHDRQDIFHNLHEINRTTGHDDRLQRIELLAQLESIESNLVDKRGTLRAARLIPSKRARMKVAIGSVVDLIDQQGQLVRYTLVDTVEANPSDGRISILSPLGSNLVGKTVQDIVEWQSNVRRSTMQLVRIS